jgi:Cdc6-like AAA superfamily ATPase
MLASGSGAVHVDKPIEERIRLVEGIRVPFPKYQESLDMIHRCRERSKKSTEPRCLLIKGPAGAGKSTVIGKYVQEHEQVFEEKYEEGIKTIRPVVKTRMSNPATIRTLIEKLLKALGDPKPSAGKTNDEKNERLSNLLNDCGVETIIIDEFHHIVHESRGKTLYEVSEWLKDITNDTKASIVLCGLPRIEMVRTQNLQVFRRFRRSVNMDRFPFKTKVDRELFRKILMKIDDVLPFKNLSGLSEPDMCKKIYNASEGLIFSIMALISDAAEIAMEQDKPYIELEDFEEAFDQNDFVKTDKSVSIIAENKYTKMKERANPFEEKAS